jgi:putative heme-binding domain-containing protein
LEIERRGAEGLALVESAMASRKLGVRARLHAVWIIAKLAGPTAADKLHRLAARADRLHPSAADEDNRRFVSQTVRALGDVVDPAIQTHRLDAGAGDLAMAQRIASLAWIRDPRVQLEVVIVLGRMRRADAIDRFDQTYIASPDAGLRHAIQWTMRRSAAWSTIFKLLDEPDKSIYRPIAKRAIAEQFEVAVVDGLIDRLKQEPRAERRREYAELLARVARKPGPWTYWGFRPPPRPANTIAWKRTAAIEVSLDRALADADRDTRLAVLRAMVREKIPASTATLGAWLNSEREPTAVALLLTALDRCSSAEAREHLERVVRDGRQTLANRLLGVEQFVRGIDAASEPRLLAVGEAVEDGPVLAPILRALGARKLRQGSTLLRAKLDSTDANIRAAAISALADVGARDADDAIVKRLRDGDRRVCAAAALAAGRLALRSATEDLLRLAVDTDPEVRRSSLEALRQLREPRAVPVMVAALGDAETAVKALEALGEVGGAAQAAGVADVARRQPSLPILIAAARALTGWVERPSLMVAERLEITRALAEIHGSSGLLLAWKVIGPVTGDGSTEVAKFTLYGTRTVFSTGIAARVSLGAATAKESWIASADIFVDESTRVEFATSASAPQAIFLNGQPAFRQDRPNTSAERFTAALAKGTNRVIVRLAGGNNPGEFQLRFRRQSARAEHERLASVALARSGNPDRGRLVFLNAEKSLCIKCHRVGEQGERVGPDLTGLGGRFAKSYIIESILEPSRTIAPSFEATLVELKNGKSLEGVKIAETDSSITLVDRETKKHVVAKSEIESQKKQSTSTMPEGLEKRLTEEEFVDLLAFLLSTKEPRRP